MSQNRRSSLFWYGVAVFNVLLATGLTQLLWDEVRLTPLLLFAIATAVSTLAGGLRPGLLAAVLSTMTFDFLFLPPTLALDLNIVGLLRLIGMGMVSVGVHVPMAARAKAERELRRTLAEMEQRVESRTHDLSVANARLTEEVAEREKAEDALRRSEQHFRSLIENASDILTVLNPDGTVRYESASVTRRFGYTQAEVLGAHPLAVIHPDDAPRVRDAFARLMRERQLNLSIEYRVRHRDGSWRIVESVADNRLNDLVMSGVVVATRDITDRRQAEEALRKSEERYRAFIAQSSEGIWRCESTEPIPTSCSEEEQLECLFQKAYIAECNDAMARMYGLGSAEDLVGSPINRLMPPSDERNVEFLRAFIRSGYRLVDAVSHEVDREGNPKWFSNTMTGIVEDGRLVRAWGTQLDVTERKKSEAALRESEARLREASQFAEEIIHNASDGIVVMDRRLRYVLWNRVMEEKFGYSAELMLGRCVYDVFPALKELGIDRLHERVLNGETVTGPDLEIRRPDGTSFWRSVTYTPHRNAQDEITGVIGLTHDITERKLAEKQLAELLAREQSARRQAEAASRLKDDFLATVSHELRTPLSAIIGWSRMLREGVVREEKIPHALETIERNDQAQTQLINDLLDVSRIISGKLLIETRPVDLAVMIASAVSTIQPAAEARAIRVDCQFDEQPQVVSGDADRLQQVVWNLLSNAVKFTPQGGRISVSLEQADAHARITVSDNGQGIPPEFLPCVFDRFSQADSSITRRHGGLGLGLAIVRHLTELHGGTVEAASAGPGQGATFTVTLPRLGRTTHHDFRPESEAANDNAEFAVSPNDTVLAVAGPMQQV